MASKLGWRPLHEETTRHPFLAEFYSDPARYALETELGFVLIHYHQMKTLDARDHWVADYSPGKDMVFGRMNLRGPDWDLFEHNYNALAREVAQPDLAIFLDLPLSALQQRIAARGRPYELGVTAEYLNDLRDHYMQFMSLLGVQSIVLQLSGDESFETVGDRSHEIISEVLFGQARLL